ncbi:MAG: hypothetical protein FWH41_09170 [Treponema sp.]|nr:hypothetical protein [Treponema sp.]
MKKNVFCGISAIVTVLALCLTLFNACGKNKDEPAKPKITGVKILYNNTDIGGTETLTVAKGGTLTFIAEVEGSKNPPQSVSWKIEGNSAGTGIAGGILTVAAAELDDALLTITATSTVDKSKSAWVKVKVLSATAPVINSVTITAAGNANSVAVGGTLQFDAVVDADNGADDTLLWEITSTGHDAGTTISQTGLLTIAAGETQTSITVKASPIEPGFEIKADSITITIGATGSPSVIAITFSSPAANIERGKTADYTVMVLASGGATEEVAWSIVSSGHSSGTKIESTGNTTCTLTAASDEPEDTITIQAASAEPGFDTVLKIFDVNVIDPLVPTVVSVTINTNATGIERGGNLLLTVKVEVEDYADTAVLWEITSSGHDAGTTINPTTGMLTIAAAETAATITVKASAREPGFEGIYDDITLNIDTPYTSNVVHQVYLGTSGGVITGIPQSFNPSVDSYINWANAGNGRNGGSAISIDIPSGLPLGTGWYGISIDQPAGGALDISGVDALSFWIRATEPCTIDGSSIFNDRAVITLQNIPVSTEWARIIIPVPSRRTGATAIRLFHLSNGNVQGKTVYVDDIALITVPGKTFNSITLPPTGGPIFPPPDTTEAVKLIEDATLEYSLMGRNFELLAGTHILNVDFWYTTISYNVTGDATIASGIITPTLLGGSFNYEVSFGSVTSNTQIVSISAVTPLLIDNFDNIPYWNGLAPPSKGSSHAANVNLGFTWTATPSDGEVITDGSSGAVSVICWYANGVEGTLARDYTASAAPTPVNIGDRTSVTFMLNTQAAVGSNWTAKVTWSGGEKEVQFNNTKSGGWEMITIPDVPPNVAITGWSVTIHMPWSGGGMFNVDDFYAR